MLALACQVDGLVAVDERLRALRPAIIWLDRRATDQSARLSDAVGEDELITRTGLNPDASHTAPKAMWLRDEEPEHYRAARWLAPVGGHLAGWLTGEVVQDPANASSTLLYDLRAGDWDLELVAQAGLDAGQAAADPARGGGDRAAPDRRPLRRSGCPRDCRVAVGTGDEHGAALGAGAVGPGVVVDVTGTAEPVAAPSDELVLDDERLVETHAHAVAGMLLIENPGFVSGGSTSWWASDAGHAPERGVRSGCAGAARQRRSAVPADALGRLGAALERPDARILRRPGTAPRPDPSGPCGPRGLRVRPARHRGPVRRDGPSAARSSGWSAAARARRCGFRSRRT